MMAQKKSILLSLFLPVLLIIINRNKQRQQNMYVGRGASLRSSFDWSSLIYRVQQAVEYTSTLVGSNGRILMQNKHISSLEEKYYEICGHRVRFRHKFLFKLEDVKVAKEDVVWTGWTGILFSDKFQQFVISAAFKSCCRVRDMTAMMFLKI